MYSGIKPAFRLQRTASPFPRGRIMDPLLRGATKLQTCIKIDVENLDLSQGLLGIWTMGTYQSPARGQIADHLLPRLAAAEKPRSQILCARLSGSLLLMNCCQRLHGHRFASTRSSEREGERETESCTHFGLVLPACCASIRRFDSSTSSIISFATGPPGRASAEFVVGLRARRSFRARLMPNCSHAIELSDLQLGQLTEASTARAELRV